MTKDWPQLKLHEAIFRDRDSANYVICLHGARGVSWSDCIKNASKELENGNKTHLQEYLGAIYHMARAALVF